MKIQVTYKALIAGNTSSRPTPKQIDETPQDDINYEPLLCRIIKVIFVYTEKEYITALFTVLN